MPSRAEAKNRTVLDSQVLCCFLNLQLLHLFMFGFVFLGLALKEDLVLCTTIAWFKYLHALSMMFLALYSMLKDTRNLWYSQAGYLS